MILADFLTWGDIFKCFALFLAIALFFALLAGIVILFDRFAK